ncbi:MAG: DUF1800 family protein [Phycisphaerales bacterium]
MADRIPTASLNPVPKAAWSYDHARHLLLRAGFGGTPQQVRLLAQWGPEKSVDHLLNFEQASAYPTPSVKTEDQDKDADKVGVAGGFRWDIMRPPTAAERAEIARARRNQDEDVLATVRLERQRREREDRDQVRTMQKWWLKRMIESPRPLEEKMTLFWHGHFATSYRTIENSWHQFVQNDLFRRNAVGSFRTLLRAIVRDPAMLKYLDNDESRKEQPNENLARELMELFALGVGAYTEADIKQGARSLTGYSFEFNDFAFRRERHDTGSKTILGRQGVFDGDDFADILLAQPACPRFITGKLYRFLVNPMEGDAAPGTKAGAVCTQVIAQLASMLASANYELKPMLRTLLLSQHFYSPANMNAHVKSPVELVVGLVRSLHTPVRDLGILNDALDLMGQNLFFPPNVAGWAGGRSWINTSTLFVRHNVANFLINGKMPKGYDPLAAVDPYDPLALLADVETATPGKAREPQTVARYLMRFMLGVDPSTQQLNQVTTYLKSTDGGVSSESLRHTLALIATMPGYQVC